MSTFYDVVATLRAAGCVFAEEEAQLLMEAAAGAAAALDSLVSRRVEGLPLEHLLGWVEFAGLRISIDPAVFVPRRRTELLVQEALSLAPPRPVVVDLCCGCGAIGTAIASSVGDVELYAADVDPAAVRSARRNVEPVGGRVFLGDLFEPLPPELRGRIDLLVVNAPYVPTEAIAMMPSEARDHEPRIALDGGRDGLHLQRRVAGAAASWLAPAGHLLIESSAEQCDELAAVFLANGLSARVAVSDELDGTAVIGQRF